MTRSEVVKEVGEDNVRLGERLVFEWEGPSPVQPRIYLVAHIKLNDFDSLLVCHYSFYPSEGHSVTVIDDYELRESF